MTVNTKKITSGPYAGNDIADTFSYTFKIDDKDEVSVYETNDLGVELLLTVDTDYTVNVVGVDGGGTITRTSGALPTGYEWFIRSDFEETQLTSFNSQGAFFPDLHENAMDKLTLLIQQILDRNDRSPRVSDTYAGALPLSLDNPQVGLGLRWNGDNSGLENADFSTVSNEEIANDKVVINYPTLLSALSDTSLKINQACNLAGRITKGDGGGAMWDVYPVGTFPTSASIFNVYDHATLPVQVKLRDTGVVSTTQWGCVTNGVTDNADSLEAQAVYLADNGGLWAWTPGKYFVSRSIDVHLTGETLTDRYNDVQADISVPFIGNITVYAFGARLVTTQSTFTTSFPFYVLNWVESENVKVLGLEFESDLNGKSTGWFDSTNYFNQAPPTGGTQAMAFVGFKDVHVEYCKALHCSVGFIAADDRNFAPVIGDEMNSYRATFTHNRIFNCAQGMSMTVGACEELIITENNFEYTFIKLVQETDQGRNVQFKNNTGRDVSGILTNCNDSQFSGNQFNNFLAGFSLQPQGGGNPDVSYNYNLLNMMIKDNIFYSDHVTPTLQGDKRPQGFLTLNASAVFTEGQAVLIDSLSVEGNKMELWPQGGSSSGAFLGRAGDADMLIKNPTFINNDCDLNNADAVIVACAPLATPTNTYLSGNLDFSNNTFNRIAGNSNFEFQFIFGTLDFGSSITFNDNECNTQGTGNQVVVKNAGRITSESNKFTMGLMSNAANGVYTLSNVPKATIEDNELINPLNTTRGSFVVMEGSTNGVYNTSFDKAVYRVNNNNADNLQFVFNSTMSFPASAEGFYELMGNVIEGNATGTFKTYGTITGFAAENVVNPSRSGIPPANALTPGYYQVWNGVVNPGDPVGWVWSTAWQPFGTQV